MTSNLDRFKRDLGSLIEQGRILDFAMLKESDSKEFDRDLKKALKAGEISDETKETLKRLPSFRNEYQSWFSESKALIQQLLPERTADFVRYYEKPKSRKEITNDNYSIEDFLEGLIVTQTRGIETKVAVGLYAALPKFRQQRAILSAAQRRFDSSLYDIRQLVQADLFDNELDAAQELAKNRFTRAAGAVAGVVLEKHLAEVCGRHGIKITKKNPTINDLNDLLKDANLIAIPQWRSIQHLADIRNLCDHNKSKDPTLEELEDLLDGVRKTTKTLF
jgi:hypothetical protein